MLRKLLINLIPGSLLWGGLLLSPLSAEDANTPAVDKGTTVQVKELAPFTHLAYVPVGSETGTIRFEKIKSVQVPTKVLYTADTRYCQEVARRGQGASSRCPEAQDEALVPAYEVTYSYQGEPMASDEYGGKSFTLHVYFRPDELAAALRQPRSARKQNRVDTAAYFVVSTYREPVQRVVVDESESTYCERGLLDGNWINRDENCMDAISYRKVTARSEYITVEIEPASSQREMRGTGSADRMQSQK